MKRNGKKLLAGVGLALVGGMTIAGCGMTEEQQAALDKVVDKADEIIELVDSNMSMQNAKLSKEEAAEKIMLARNYWLSKNLQMKLYYDNVSYNGFYDKASQKYSVTAYYLKDEDMFRSVTIAGENENYDTYYKKRDYKKNVYYDYSEYSNTGNEHFSSSTYTNTESFKEIYGADIVAQCGFGAITPDMIMDLDVVENGYTFTVINYEISEDGVSGYNVSRNKLVITLENDKITSFNAEHISLDVKESFNGLEKDAEGNFVDPEDIVFAAMVCSNDLEKVGVITYQGYYQYENLNLTDVNDKYTAIEKKYLSNE